MVVDEHQLSSSMRPASRAEEHYQSPTKMKYPVVQTFLTEMLERVHKDGIKAHVRKSLETRDDVAAVTSSIWWWVSDVVGRQIVGGPQRSACQPKVL